MLHPAPRLLTASILSHGSRHLGYWVGTLLFCGHSTNSRTEESGQRRLNAGPVVLTRSGGRKGEPLTWIGAETVWHTRRLPKAVAAHISLLIPHLGGKAYALRSAIVTSVGFLVQNAYSDPPEGEADAQGEDIPANQCIFTQHTTVSSLAELSSCEALQL